LKQLVLISALALSISACATTNSDRDKSHSASRVPATQGEAREAASKIAEECGESVEGLAFKYCITRANSNSNTDVLYFLHIGNGNEHQWKQDLSDVQSELAKTSAQPPVVITVSFGPFWLLVEKNKTPKSGLLEVFRDQIMPKMEMLALGRQAQRRLLMGASMGGFNSAALLLKLPPKTFDRVVIACPALLDLSPWASEADTAAFIQRLNVHPKTVENMSKIAKMFVADEKTWKEKVNPLDLIAKRESTPIELPPLLVAGNKDDRNFFEGASIFAQKATERAKGTKAVVNWKSWPGGHCQLDAAATAGFLTAVD